MIKIFFYILLILFPITTNAISLQEIRDNPQDSNTSMQIIEEMDT